MWVFWKDLSWLSIFWGVNRRQQRICQSKRRNSFLQFQRFCRLTGARSWGFYGASQGWRCKRKYHWQRGICSSSVLFLFLMSTPSFQKSCSRVCKGLGCWCLWTCLLIFWTFPSRLRSGWDSSRLLCCILTLYFKEAWIYEGYPRREGVRLDLRGCLMFSFGPLQHFSFEAFLFKFCNGKY